MSATVKELLKSDSICKSYAEVTPLQTIMCLRACPGFVTLHDRLT